LFGCRPQAESPKAKDRIVVGKSFAVLIYLLCGAMIASWPIMVQWALQYENGPLRDLQRWIEKPAVESNVGTLLVRYSWPSGIICGLLIGSTLVWWPASYASISIPQYSIYGLIVVSASVLLVPCHRPLMSAQPLRRGDAEHSELACLDQRIGTADAGETDVDVMAGGLRGDLGPGVKPR
jgi:hypothetical protein